VARWVSGPALAALRTVMLSLLGERMADTRLCVLLLLLLLLLLLDGVHDLCSRPMPRAARAAMYYCRCCFCLPRADPAAAAAAAALSLLLPASAIAAPRRLTHTHMLLLHHLCCACRLCPRTASQPTGSP
jgi:hypothetical protein